MGARILNGLALTLVVATGLLIGLFLAVVFHPQILPHPAPSPIPTPEEKATEMLSPPTPSSAFLPFPTPTPLRPATLSPSLTPPVLFTARVELANARMCAHATLTGIVQGRDGKGLAGYPLHLWGFGLDTVVFTDSQGRWEIVLPGGGKWHIQLHAPDPEGIYPPLSTIIVISLPENHPCASVVFHTD